MELSAPRIGPYRDGPLPHTPPFADTRRLLRATRLSGVLAASVLVSVFVPSAGRSLAREAVDALLDDGSWLPAAIVASIVAIVVLAILFSLAPARGGSPPLRVERRAMCVGTLVFIGVQLVLGHAIVVDASTQSAIRLPMLLPVVLLPIAALATCAAWKCEGWEGWAYSLASLALALAGSAITTAFVNAVQTNSLPRGIGIVASLYLGSVVALVLVATWAAAPLARTHDLYTYAGMGALAAAIDAVAMTGLGILQGMRSAAELSTYAHAYGPRSWWESYFLAQELLALAALALALPSVVLARQRRYGLAGLVLLGLFAWL